uniref:AB hydrolase-1 domain-containing protein n=1 Tax=Oryza punctata TaxID=4537 RepID=A0A0E0JKQ6_ORYPU
MPLNPRVVGCGERTLVLSHGYGGSQAIWDRVLPHLAETNKVLLFDWDFSGGGGGDDDEAEEEEERYTFERYADELVALMEDMGVSGAVYVGHSMAGMIGCIASIKRPDLFTHLVLVGASPRYINSDDYEGGFDEPEIDAMLATISSDFLSWAKGFVPLVIGVSADDDPSAVETLARTFFAMDPRVAHALARMIFLGDNRGVLGRVAAPCTLVHASGDLAAPPCVGHYMEGRIARAAMVTVDSAGHFPQLVAPDEMLRILDAVLANNGGAVADEEAAKGGVAVVVEERGSLAAVGEVEVKGDIDVATEIAS